MSQTDRITWTTKWDVRKFWAEDMRSLGIDPDNSDPKNPTREILRAALNEDALRPYEIINGEGNLLMYGGAGCIWDNLKGLTTNAYFTNALAQIGVGDSATAAAATQTDLQAATNKFRQGMEATYPIHTDGTTSGAADIIFRSLFATGDANYAWEEWGVFNAAAGGRMLNRKVESLGTKTSAASWELTVTLTLA